MPKDSKEKSLVQRIIDNPGVKLGVLGGATVLGNEIRKQAVGSRVIREQNQARRLFDPMPNNRKSLSPAYDPVTGRKEGLTSPARAARTQQRLKEDVAGLKGLKQRAQKVQAEDLARRESKGAFDALKEFGKRRPKLPAGVQNAVTNLGLGSRVAGSSAPAPEVSKNKVTPTRAQQQKVRREVGVTPKTRYQANAYAAKLQSMAKDDIFARANKPLFNSPFRKPGDAIKTPSLGKRALNFGVVTALTALAPKGLDIAGELNSQRIEQNKTGKKPDAKPGAGNTNTAAVDERAMQAEYSRIVSEANNLLAKEGYTTDDARSYVLDRMSKKGPVYKAYAEKNVKLMR
jgi:hypothetical protein